MGMIEKMKNAGQQAVSGARETLGKTQLRRQLDHAYSQLGRGTYNTVQDGTLIEQRLSYATDIVGELDRKLADFQRSDSTRQQHGTMADLSDSGGWEGDR